MRAAARKSRRAAQGAAIAAALALGCLCAAPVPSGAVVTVGEAAPPSSVGGGCIVCTFFQWQTGGGASFSMPADGVITAFRVRSGSSMSAPDAVQLRVFRPLDAPPWQIIGESENFSLAGMPANSLLPFGARVPVKAGDILGARSTTFFGDTPQRFATGSGGDVVGAVIGDPAVGDVLGAPPSIGNSRVNIEADLEPDTDHDGFGDETQDVCPTVAGPAGGCHGALIGSPLINVTTGGGTCTGPCTIAPGAISGASIAVPYRAVLLHWAQKGSIGAATYGARVLRPAPGGGFTVVAESATVPVSAGTTNLISGDTRLPLLPGDEIALNTDGRYSMWSFPGAGSTDVYSPQPAQGAATGAPSGTFLDTEPLFAGIIEPDADGDQYGDVSEDRCPTDPAEHGDCPKPVVTKLKVSPGRFCANPRGYAIANSCKRGAKISLTLSKASRVQFIITHKVKVRGARPNCAPPKNKRQKLRVCTLNKAVHWFTRMLPAGPNRFTYAGRYKKRGAARLLTPGKYTLVAQPTSTLSSVVGASVKARFRIGAR